MTRQVRIAALLLVVGLLAGPAATHVYWLLGGTWGLYTDGVRDEVASTGVRIVAAVVLVLLAAAVLVVLARAGLWRQRLLPDRIVRLGAWAVAVVFALETLASFTWGRAPEWWMYGPVSLVLAVLAFVVARADGKEARSWPRSSQGSTSA